MNEELIETEFEEMKETAANVLENCEICNDC